MYDNFVPECYFDTVLVKNILKTKRVNHKKGCPNVVKEIEKGKLKDDFAVGIIDKDKKELDYIKNKCEEQLKSKNLVLLKHKEKQHYFIQLMPALEKWIIVVSGESGINIEEYGLSKDLEKLKKITKSEIASENENLKRLCRDLVNSNGETINTLTKWLKYLYDNNRNADINALK